MRIKYTGKIINRNIKVNSLLSLLNFTLSACRQNVIEVATTTQKFE
jgi:hypothetical protein